MFEMLAGNPEVVTGVIAALVILVGALGVKYSKFKKYSEVIVGAIEGAKSTKDVKKKIREAVEEAVGVNTQKFVDFVKGVVG